MAFTTNRLVAGSRRLALPSLAAAAVVCSVLALHQPGVHASAISAAPLDDHSVTALTALDKDMETLAARVTPAVVNVAVTSRAGKRRAGGDNGRQAGAGSAARLCAVLRQAGWRRRTADAAAAHSWSTESAAA